MAWAALAKLFAPTMWAGVEPDVMAVAKGIGGGFRWARSWPPRRGRQRAWWPVRTARPTRRQPLAMAVGNAVLDAILEPGFPRSRAGHGAAVLSRGWRLRTKTPLSSRRCAAVALLIGLGSKPPVAEVVAACMAEGLLTVGAGENVVRLLPPLNVSEAEIGEAVTRLSRALKRVAKPAA